MGMIDYGTRSSRLLSQIALRGLRHVVGSVFARERVASILASQRRTVPPLDGAKYKGYAWDGEKIEAKGKEPHTLGYFVSAAKQQVKLFRLLYGEENKAERLDALKHLRKLHGEKPELFTAHFIVEAWSRMWFEFRESVRGGIRPLLRILPGGANREALASLASIPYGKSGKKGLEMDRSFRFPAKKGNVDGQASA